MLNEKQDFIDALERFVKDELKRCDEPADYNNEAIEIADARNHYFRNVGKRGTDEEQGIFAIRSLCRVDETTLDIVPDRQKLAAIARELGLNDEIGHEG